MLAQSAPLACYSDCELDMEVADVSESVVLIDCYCGSCYSLGSALVAEVKRWVPDEGIAVAVPSSGHLRSTLLLP